MCGMKDVSGKRSDGICVCPNCGAKISCFCDDNADLISDDNKVFPAGILADCGRENAPLYLFADSTLYKAELRELYSTIKHFDVLPNALAFVASPMVALALEPWIAGFLALLHTPEEVLIGSV